MLTENSLINNTQSYHRIALYNSNYLNDYQYNQNNIKMINILYIKV